MRVSHNFLTIIYDRNFLSIVDERGQLLESVLKGKWRVGDLHEADAFLVRVVVDLLEPRERFITFFALVLVCDGHG